MKCPQCKMVEMLVKSVKDNIVQHVCKKCGKTISQELPQPKE